MLKGFPLICGVKEVMFFDACFSLLSEHLVIEDLDLKLQRTTLQTNITD